MSEGILVYKYYSEEIFEKKFFDITRVNYMYNRRRMYCIRNGKLENNNYFPLNEIRNTIKFYTTYLSAYATDDYTSLDTDFDIGFNNIDYDIEKEIVFNLMNKYMKSVIVRILNSYENRNLIDEIENKYEVIPIIKENLIFIS